jgi:hypothetical protein
LIGPEAQIVGGEKMRAKMAIIVAFTIAAFLIACQLAAVRAPAPETIPMAGGTVTDAVTQQFLDGALVEITPAPEIGSASCITGADGKYLFYGVHSPYNLTVTKAGYVPQTVTDLWAYSGQVTTRNFMLEPIQLPVPEVPWGTITASLAMMLALAGYFAIPKFRKRT